MKKTLLSLMLIGTFVLFGCSQTDSEIENPADNDSTAEQTESLSVDPLGPVSIDFVLLDMPTEFTVEPGDEWDFTAFSKSKFARIDFTGTEEDLTEVSLTTALNINGNKEASSENTSITAVLLTTLFPDDDVVGWLVPVLAKYKTDGGAYEEATFGNKHVEAIVDENGILYLTITIE